MIIFSFPTTHHRATFLPCPGNHVTSCSRNHQVQFVMSIYSWCVIFHWSLINLPRPLFLKKANFALSQQPSVASTSSATVELHHILLLPLQSPQTRDFVWLVLCRSYTSCTVTLNSHVQQSCLVWKTWFGCRNPPSGCKNPSSGCRNPPSPAQTLFAPFLLGLHLNLGKWQCVINVLLRDKHFKDSYSF